MRANGSYDVAVIGGGLGGLALSIQSARAGYATILFEKEQYPFHRVCGEYISLESWNFLEELGLPLSDMSLPLIRRVQVSAPNGNMIEHRLPLGGFGISRYFIDHQLAQIAKHVGVEVADGTKVTDAPFVQWSYQIASNSLRSSGSTGNIYCLLPVKYHNNHC